MIARAKGLSLQAYMDIIENSVTLPLYGRERDFAFTSAFVTGRVMLSVLGICVCNHIIAIVLEKDIA